MSANKHMGHFICKTQTVLSNTNLCRSKRQRSKCKIIQLTGFARNGCNSDDQREKRLPKQKRDTARSIKQERSWKYRATHGSLCQKFKFENIVQKTISEGKQLKDAPVIISQHSDNGNVNVKHFPTSKEVNKLL
jgi:hypothetical protein